VHLRSLLRRVYLAPRAPQVSRDELDDLHILDAWLRRNAARVTEVPVSVDAPEAAAAPALAAINMISPPAARAAGATKAAV
jgi:hypothetical protein